MKSFFLGLLFLVAGGQLAAQQSWFVTWGYNRGYYLPSDIHLKGPDVDLEFKDVEAADDPEPFSKTYYALKGFTIPQFDFRIGVYLKNNLRLSWGWEHMKYQTTVGSSTVVNGEIKRGSKYSDFYERSYNNEESTISKSFFYTEHTDGLNYVNFELEKGWSLPLLKDKIALLAYAGVGTGPMLPWSDSYFLGEHFRNPLVHFVGWGVNLQAKPEIQFYDRVFVELATRVGRLWMWDILIDRGQVKAQQNIWFLEYNISLGYRFKIGKK